MRTLDGALAMVLMAGTAAADPLPPAPGPRDVTWSPEADAAYFAELATGTPNLIDIITRMIGYNDFSPGADYVEQLSRRLTYDNFLVYYEVNGFDPSVAVTYYGYNSEDDCYGITVVAGRHHELMGECFFVNFRPRHKIESADHTFMDGAISVVYINVSHRPVPYRAVTVEPDFGPVESLEDLRAKVRRTTTAADFAGWTIAAGGAGALTVTAPPI